MSTPKRIQMTRQRPWRAENPDAVIVARPSKWGNPFKVGDVAMHCHRAASHPYHFYVDSHRVVRADQAVSLFRAIISNPAEHQYVGHETPTVAAIRTELAGRDLACWCPLDSPCHGDVLLAIAAGKEL